MLPEPPRSSQSNPQPTSPIESSQLPTNAENSPDPSTWTRHPTLYMTDGTVVLLAGSQLFRVYGGLLSRHSDVFRGMFSLSDHQPAGADSYDGVPLVRLSDDPEDVTHFLGVLHDFNYFPDTGYPVPFHVVAGTLRLATKYMVPQMRYKAIDYLYNCYSANFDRYFDGALSNRVSIFGSEVDAPHPFALITFLRECNVEKLLPHAFLEACERGFDALLWGETFLGSPFTSRSPSLIRPPSTVGSFSISGRGSPSPAAGNGSPLIVNNDEVIRLSPEDTKVALDGWQLLREAELKILLAVYDEFADDCPWGMCDQRVRIDGLKDDIETFTYDRRLLPFTPRRINAGFCDSCLVERTEFVREELRRVWQEIPDYFGLPSWEVLLHKED